MNGQACEQLTLFPADSPASPIASLENVPGIKTKGICGLNLCVYPDFLSQEPLWLRMCLAYYLRFMTPFAPTWKKKVTESGRFVYRLTLSMRTMRDIGWLILPSTRASQDFKPIRKQTPQEHCGKHGNALVGGIGVIYPELIGQYINPQLSEWLMGFPEGWTDVHSTKK